MHITDKTTQETQGPHPPSPGRCPRHQPRVLLPAPSLFPSPRTGLLSPLRAFSPRRPGDEPLRASGRRHRPAPAPLPPRQGPATGRHRVPRPPRGAPGRSSPPPPLPTCESGQRAQPEPLPLPARRLLRDRSRRRPPRLAGTLLLPVLYGVRTHSRPMSASLAARLSAPHPT